MEGALHSLAQLDLAYIDLYLIHWPGTRDLDVSDQRNPSKEFRVQNIKWKHNYVWHVFTFLLQISVMHLK